MHQFRAYTVNIIQVENPVITPGFFLMNASWDVWQAII